MILVHLCMLLCGPILDRINALSRDRYSTGLHTVSGFCTTSAPFHEIDPDCRTLEIRNTRITSLAGIHHLRSLTEVVLESNREMTAQALEDVAALPGLVELTVSGCPQLMETLAQIVRKGCFMQLQRLTIGSNSLHTLPPEVANLRHLVSLSLYDNHLTSFPATVLQLPLLSILDIGGNPIQKLPRNIFTLLKSITLLDVARCPLQEAVEDCQSMGRKDLLLEASHAACEVVQHDNCSCCIQLSS